MSNFNWQNKTAIQISKELRKRLKRHDYNDPDIGFYNVLLLDLLRLEKEREQQIKIYETNKSLENSERLQDVFNREKLIHELLRETQERFRDKHERTFNEIIELQSLHRLLPSEKDHLKDLRKLYEFQKRLHQGSLKKSLEFFEGDFELIIGAWKGDQGSQIKILKKLETLIRSLKGQYRKYHMQISDGEIYEGMMEAINQWQNNKYLRQIEWIKGIIRRKLKEVRKKEFRHRKRITAVDHDLLQEIESNENGMYQISGEKDEFSKEKDEIWIEEMAEFIGVSPQTLRNWDKKGIFKAKKLRKGNKEFNVYETTDIAPLRKIKEERRSRGNQAIRGYHKITEVEAALGISVKTIKRMEKAGKLPIPKRDKNNHRIYSKSDIKKIKKHLKSPS